MPRLVRLCLPLLLAAGALAQSGDFKQRIAANDPFVAHGNTGRWVKFTIELSQPDAVQFQNSRLHAFHYDAVTAGLPGYQGISRADFDAQALRNQGRTLLLGAVLFPKPTGFGSGGGIGIPGMGPGIGLPNPLNPTAGGEDFGIQLIGLDPLPRELVRDAFAAVQAAVAAGQGAQAFYMPTPNQRAVVEQNQQFFADAGIEVSSPARWSGSDAVYSPGWALGRLVQLPPGEIEAAFADGRLRPEDILLTDGVPNDMPRVAGIVTLAPASDNSHVAILAQTWEIPFVFPQPGTIQDELQRLVGRRVLLRVGKGEGEAAQLDDLQHLAQPLVDAILALKAPRAIAFPPAELQGAPGLTKDKDDLWLETRDLTPADAKRVGGKAAHFGILHRSLGAQSPRAIALTADLFDAFLSSDYNGAPLREHVRATFAKHQAILDGATPPHSYPADRLPELRADLAELRDIVEDDVRLPDAIRDDVLEILADHFPPNLRLRFRSSSNLEDGAFSGAGLYRSASSRSRSERVFQAIRRVYASFYTERAVLERLRHRVDEDQVFMGLAVHRTFPDEIELANGVATLEVDPNGFTLELATQLGAASAVLPEDGATAELVSMWASGSFVQVNLERTSSLVPLGGHVLDWSNEQAEYKQLARLLERVAAEYSATTGVESPRLDLEFKKLRENGAEVFVVKQVRPLPERAPASQQIFLVQPAAQPTLTVFQGEQADAYALHRLKCEVRFGLRGTGFELDDQAFARSFLDDVRFTSAVDGELRTLEGDPASWAGASYAFDPQTRRARFSWERPARNPGVTTLILDIPAFDARNTSPVVLLDEVRTSVEASYRDPVPTSVFGSPTTTLDAARLSPLHTGPLPQGARAQDMRVEAGGLTLNGQVVWPPYPGGIIAGYTAPLLAWEGPLLLEGLIPGETLRFEDHYSRTYRPDHHNFGRTFALEPAISPAIDASVKDRLRALRVRKLYLNSQNQAFVEDFDGKLEPWPRPAGPAAAAEAAPAQPATPGIEGALEDGSK